MLAGFFFLRFVCPAIIAPDGYGLLEPGGASHLPYFAPALALTWSHSLALRPEVVSALVRRNLVIVSKVLQNIANNAQFSTKKEAFMAPMNPVVQAHQPVVQAFLTEMANPVRVANWQQPCLVGIFFSHSPLICLIYSLAHRWKSRQPQHSRTPTCEVSRTCTRSCTRTWAKCKSSSLPLPAAKQIL